MRIDLLALYYPEIATLVCEGCRMLPVVIPIDLVFNDSTGTVIGSHTAGSFKNQLSEPVIVHSLNYVVERPNADNGSILKGDSDWKTGLDPYVDVNIQLQDSKVLPRYTINVGSTPLANVVANFRDCWPAGWLVEPLQNPLVTGTLTRNLEPKENPYRVRISVNGWQIDCLADIYRSCCAAPIDELRARCLAGIKKLQG